jgi:ribA/ribD-fused uncharacterized protein
MIAETRETNTHIYFWNSVFSNFYNIEFEYNGHIFACTEQAFMWEKANYFNDTEIGDIILRTTVPIEVKRLGRQVKNFDAEKWMNVCTKYMYLVNLEKWKLMKDIILSTGDKILVEASPFDKIWGVGLAKDNNKILDDKNWLGLNLLGYVLMDVRETLKNV